MAPLANQPTDDPPITSEGGLTGEIAAHALRKEFLTGRRRIVVFDDLNVSLPAGTFTALVGPSGCGKTTLLRMLAGLEAATAGVLTVDALSPTTHRKSHDLAIAFQDSALLPWRSVAANVRFPLELAYGRARAKDGECVARIDELLELVGLQAFRSARPGQLSGGMRQRCAIARALVMEPVLLLLDEPFASVDEITRRKLNADLLHLLRSRRHATVLVTHSIFEACLLADTIIVFSALPARIVASVAVRLPAERTLELTRSPEFAVLVNEVTDALYSGSNWAEL